MCGDQIVHRADATGTMKGDFMGIPATGKRATWTEIHIGRGRQRPPDRALGPRRSVGHARPARRSSRHPGGSPSRLDRDYRSLVAGPGVGAGGLADWEREARLGGFLGDEAA